MAVAQPIRLLPVQSPILKIIYDFEQAPWGMQPTTESEGDCIEI